MRLHCFLVTMGVVFALVPAIADQFALLASTIYVQDAFFWITYSGGWVALLSLLWLFLYFMRVLPSVSAIVWVGLIGGLSLLVAFLWPVLTISSCQDCYPPKGVLVYRPNLLCIVVAAHWAYLYSKGFRLVREEFRKGTVMVLVGALIMGGPIAIFLFISTFSRFFSENTVLGWHYVSAFLLPIYAPIGLCVALFGGVRRFTGRAEGGRSPH